MSEYRNSHHPNNCEKAILAVLGLFVAWLMLSISSIHEFGWCAYLTVLFVLMSALGLLLIINKSNK